MWERTIIVALCMVVILGFVALAIDAGAMYEERAELQSAADAAALAVAQECASGGADCTQEGAEALALKYAKSNLRDNFVKVEAVTLTGSAVDTDGSIVSVSWSDESGVLTTNEILNTTLPVGTHTLTFSATDNDGATSTDSVLVTVIANQAPIANAGDDQTVSDEDGNGNQVVTLDGTDSADGDGAIVSYQWTEGSTPLGSQASISPELGSGRT